MKIKTWKAVDRGEQQNAVIQSYLELVLSSISTVAVMMSLIILLLLRYFAVLVYLHFKLDEKANLTPENGFHESVLGKSKVLDDPVQFQHKVK